MICAQFRGLALAAAGAFLALPHGAYGDSDPFLAAESALGEGRYGEANALAAKLALSDPSHAEAVRGEALFAEGRYSEARHLLESTVARDPKALRARLALGRVYRATGEEALAKAIWNRFYDDYERGGLDKHRSRRSALRGAGRALSRRL